MRPRRALLGPGMRFRSGSIQKPFSHLAPMAAFWLTTPTAFRPDLGSDGPLRWGWGARRAVAVPQLFGMGHRVRSPRCSPRVFLLPRQRRSSWPDGQEFCSGSCHGWGRSWHLPRHIWTPPRDAALRGRRALRAPPAPPPHGHDPHRGQVWHKERSCWDAWRTFGAAMSTVWGEMGTNGAVPPREQ